MPKALEEKLKKEAKKKGLTGAEFDAYVYGALRKAGWVPKVKRTKKQNNLVLNWVELLAVMRGFSFKGKEKAPFGAGVRI